jgi:hypothetical protein
MPPPSMPMPVGMPSAPVFMPSMPPMQMPGMPGMPGVPMP